MDLNNNRFNGFDHGFDMTQGTLGIRQQHQQYDNQFAQQNNYQYRFPMEYNLPVVQNIPSRDLPCVHGDFGETSMVQGRQGNLYVEEPCEVLGIPYQGRQRNEEQWYLLSENRYFALVGASAVTHCYPINMTYDTERLLTDRFEADVDRMYQDLRPPDSLTSHQKARLQQLIERLEKTWNASYGNMTSLHDASNRFMAFNTNVGAPASNVPSHLQHKFRALAHTALRILHLPINDHNRTDNIPRSIGPNNLLFWKHASKRFGRDNKTLLKGWLLMHFNQPYPTDEDKKILSQVTGMSRTQLGNWFINQRVRWWRPMVESLVQELEAEEREQYQQLNQQRRRQLQLPQGQQFHIHEFDNGPEIEGQQNGSNRSMDFSQLQHQQLQSQQQQFDEQQLLSQQEFLQQQQQQIDQNNYENRNNSE